MPANTPPNAQEWALIADAAATIRHHAGLASPIVPLPIAQALALIAVAEHCAATHTGITAAEAGRRASRPHAHASEADRREARRAAMARWRAKKKKK